MWKASVRLQIKSNEIFFRRENTQDIISSSTSSSRADSRNSASWEFYKFWPNPIILLSWAITLWREQPQNDLKILTSFSRASSVGRKWLERTVTALVWICISYEKKSRVIDNEKVKTYFDQKEIMASTKHFQIMASLKSTDHPMEMKRSVTFTSALHEVVRKIQAAIIDEILKFKDKMPCRKMII